MCEFCLKHGEGEKWYLQARNYSEDMLSDIRRRTYIKNFLSDTDGMAKKKRLIDYLDNIPRFIKEMFGWIITKQMKKTHFGQVVPLEEVERIFGFVNSIVRVACLCRHVSFGKEKRYCYGISLGPDGGMLADIFRGLGNDFLGGANTAGLETLTKKEAIAAFRAHEKEGLCHTVWTLQTPFIGGICNCDLSGCLAMRLSVKHAIPIMFRGEYVAQIVPKRCTGCGKCVSACQFGAIRQTPHKQVLINPLKCYGCGICRAFCNQGAVKLEERINVKAAANLWT
ncbi:MAG: 4Fe-4S binding protein [Candidatus Omnitrophica bacterium]|nr:4Fe-4S binding protein [Candidatus Omnitrophota bacterium]MBU4478640.1 4Fe-4S binding protein [Candidatus Omnitrophota bacterium]